MDSLLLNRKYYCYCIFFFTISIYSSISVIAQTGKSEFTIAAFPSLKNAMTNTKPAGPDWMHKASFYQIYPQSFKDTNGDGIGDLKGVISQLDYVKSLGVDAIWINPFYVSPFRDAGYDVADYYHVDPRYGTDQDAKDLFRIAKQKGLRVIVDFVPGHTSIDHPWFKASCSQTPNKYSNWFIWTNGTWFDDENGKYKINFIQGYADRDGNFMTNFFWHQPALNYGYGRPDPKQPWQLSTTHPDVVALRAEMKNIMRYWLEMGCDGFRVDMAGSLVKNDPEGSIKYFWQDIRKMLDTEYPYAFMVSEWSAPVAAINAGFHADFMLWEPEFQDLFMRENSYFRSSGQGSISHFISSYLEKSKGINGKGYISLTVGNHDLERLNNKGRNRADLEIIQVFNFTMPNVPFIYYGDEIAMRQLPVITGKEGCYGTRAGARTPMQWDATINLGFSTAPADKLYLPVDTVKNAPNVLSQEKDPSSFLNFTRKLVALHKSEPALTNYAEFVPVYVQKNKYPFIYMRVFGDEKLLVILNPDSKPATALINGELKAKRKLLLGTLPGWKSKAGTTEIQVTAQSYSVLKIK